MTKRKQFDSLNELIADVKRRGPCGCDDCERQRGARELMKLVPYLEVSYEVQAGCLPVRLSTPVRVF